MGNDFETLFSEFKRLHKNNREQYNPTEENVKRWQWHLTQRKIAPPVKKMLRPTKKIDRNIAPRKISKFDEFPAYMVPRWGEIASHFPGVQVWATGSRVAGEYIERWSNDEIKEWRQRNFKKPTIESDYDFYIDGKPTPVGQLPKWADWVRGRIHESQRIKIPMWDFKKLPKEKHQTAIDMYLSGDVKGLLDMHNEFNLSIHNYCCELDGFLRWWDWAIEQQIIHGGEVSQKTKKDHQLD